MKTSVLTYFYLIKNYCFNLNITVTSFWKLTGYPTVLMVIYTYFFIFKIKKKIFFNYLHDRLVYKKRLLQNVN